MKRILYAIVAFYYRRFKKWSAEEVLRREG